jgi:hypothetical protein
VDLGDSRVTHQPADQRVLAGAGPDDENPHGR